MMKTNYLTAVALGLLAALSGCQAEDDAPHTSQGTIPIGFSGDMPETRAAKEYGTTADLTDFGVFTYLTTGGKFNESTATPNFMYNQKVERQSGNRWTYSPVKYWPGNEKEYLSFFAYAPYVDETAAGGSNPTFSGNAAKGYPTLTYTVPAAEGSQVDLLAARPLRDRTYSGTGNIQFAMKHALTKVGVYVQSKDDVAGKKVTAFSITSAKSGTLTYRALAPGDAADTGTGWTYPAPATTETFTATATDFAVPDTKAAERKLLATFFLLPRGEGSTFSITYTAPGTTNTGAAITQTISLTGQPLPSLDQWTQGAFVTYTIGIEKKKITVTAATHPAWTDGGKGTVTGGFVITHPQGDGAEWTPDTSETLHGTETDIPVAS